jgi:hypothetical protein
MMLLTRHTACRSGTIHPLISKLIIKGAMLSKSRGSKLPCVRVYHYRTKAAMVFLGKPSGSCKLCRERKIKVSIRGLPLETC